MILNLTQHQTTPEQFEAGVTDLPAPAREELKKLLTFNDVPTCEEINRRVKKIGSMVAQYIVRPFEFKEDNLFFCEDEEDVAAAQRNGKALGYKFMIGGAPFLMSPLAEELSYFGDVVYAFSKRVSVEKEINGEVVKHSVFKHAGFVPAC